MAADLLPLEDLLTLHLDAAAQQQGYERAGHSEAGAQAIAPVPSRPSPSPLTA